MLVAQNSLGPVCPVPLTVRGTDFVSRLQALSALRDDGHLTDAEFAKAKQKLLDE